MQVRCRDCEAVVGASRARWCEHCGAALSVAASTPEPSRALRDGSGRGGAWSWGVLAAGVAAVVALVVVAPMPETGAGGRVEGDVSLPEQPGVDGAMPADDDRLQGPGEEEERAGTRVRFGLDFPRPPAGAVLHRERVITTVGAEVLALSTGSGATAWMTELEGVEDFGEPMAAGGYVVVAADRESLHVLDADTGEQLWSDSATVRQVLLALPSSPTGGGLRVSSEAVAVVTDGHTARALSLADGEQLWTRIGVGALASGRAGQTVVGVGDEQLVGLDARTGVMRWEVELEGRELAGRPDQTPTAVVVALDDRLEAVDVGRGRWYGGIDLHPDTIRGNPQIGVAGRIVVSSGDALLAYNVDGQLLWRRELEPPVSLIRHDELVLALRGGVAIRGIEPHTGEVVLELTPSGWFGAVDVDADTVVVAMYTPTEGRLVVHDWSPSAVE